MNIVQFAIKLQDGASSALRGVAASARTVTADVRAFGRAGQQSMRFGDRLPPHVREWNRYAASLNDVTEAANRARNAIRGASQEQPRKAASSSSKGGGLMGSVGGFLKANLWTAAITEAASQFSEFIGKAQEAWNIQSMAEKRLEVVMQQRMNATAAEIQQMKDLASAQQKVGVVGDEVQLSGAQQLATFVRQKQSLETLMPAMNNLLAQQKGLNATAEDAVGIGNLMGKVMTGQTSALTRVGITFSEAQEKILKYGSEQQKAATLAQVITDNVGKMNEALAATPEGRLKQMQNDYGDLQEQVGRLMLGVKTAFAPLGSMLVNVMNRLVPYIDKIVKPLAAGVQTFVGYIRQSKGMLAEMFAPVVDFVKKLTSGTAQWRSYILTIRDVFVNGVLPAFKSTLKTIVSIADGIISFVKNSEILKDVFSAIGGFAIGLFNAVKKVTELFGWLWNNVVSPILNGVDKMYKYVKELMGYKLKSAPAARAAQIQAPTTVQQNTLSTLKEIATNTQNNDKTTQEASKGIASGGPKVVNISVGKFFDNLTFNTQNLSESATDIENAVLECLTRVLAQGAATV